MEAGIHPAEAGTGNSGAVHREVGMASLGVAGALVRRGKVALAYHDRWEAGSCLVGGHRGEAFLAFLAYRAYRKEGVGCLGVVSECFSERTGEEDVIYLLGKGREVVDGRLGSGRAWGLRRIGLRRRMRR